MSNNIMHGVFNSQKENIDFYINENGFVQVIHCKDCKYYERLLGECERLVIVDHTTFAEEGDYCSWAEIITDYGTERRWR